MADGRHLEKSKTAISPQRLDRFAQNLAWWRIPHHHISSGFMGKIIVGKKDPTNCKNCKTILLNNCSTSCCVYCLGAFTGVLLIRHAAGLSIIWEKLDMKCDYDENDITCCARVRSVEMRRWETTSYHENSDELLVTSYLHLLQVQRQPRDERYLHIPPTIINRHWIPRYRYTAVFSQIISFYILKDGNEPLRGLYSLRWPNVVLVTVC